MSNGDYLGLGYMRSKTLLGLAAALLVGMSVVGGGVAPRAFAADKPAIKVISPTEGATITGTDIPVQVEVSNFKVAAGSAGLPDKPGEGHIHVMLDGMNMGVMFNFYTSTSFALPGEGIPPGQHTLIFDLATNSHMDMEDTVKQVKINYQPANPKPAPAAATTGGPPSVEIISPANGATVGPQFTIEVKPTNFTPSLDLEGKRNLAGYGHYHVWVDMNMEMGGMSGESGQGGTSMMGMAGMIGMPGSNTIPVDLSAWANGKHTILVEPVQNDHVPIQGARHAMITINLTGSSGTGKMMEEQMGGNMGEKGGDTMPKTGAGDAPFLVVLLGLVALTLGSAGILLRRLRA